MLKVAKFGGSSLSNPAQWEKIKNIVLNDDSIKVVVVSALGKDDVRVSKITDLLLLLSTHLELGIDYESLFLEITKRFLGIKKALQLSLDIELELKNLKRELSNNLSKDYLISRGEYFTSKLMSEYLGFVFVDSLDCIFVDYSGSVEYDKTNIALQNIFKEKGKIVVPGFYANAPLNKVRLFSRGGSDLTGSIISNALDVSLYENWTDVDGLFVADPKLVNNADPIKQITYRELRELSYRGANVIHEETIIPLENKRIPIQIKNTNKPDVSGTIISSNFEHNGSYVTGIAGKKDYTSFNIVKKSVFSKIKVLRDVLNIFYRYNVNVENIPSGIDSFSVIVESSQIKACSFDLFNDIHNILEVNDVQIEESISLIAVVGKNMASIPGVAGKLFASLGDKGINIKIIAQGSAELSIIIGVHNDDYNDAINTIYDEFYLKNK